MLKKFFHGFQSDGKEKIKDLTLEQNDLLNVLDTNINFLNSIQNEEDVEVTFDNVIFRFDNIYSNLSDKQYNLPAIKEVFTTFLKTCARFGENILDNLQITSHMFLAISNLCKIYFPLPSSKDFVNLFIVVLLPTVYHIHGE